LAQIDATIAEAGAAGRVARAQYAPQLQFQVGYMISEMETDSYQAMIGLSLPLGIGWRRGAVVEAEADARAARFDQAEWRLRVEQEAIEAFAAFQAAARNAAALQAEVLPRADAAYQATFASYSAGRDTLTSVLAAARSLHETRLQTARAVTETHRQYAALLRAAGVAQPGEIGAPAAEDQP
jgi:outer membrane protein TolC